MVVRQSALRLVLNLIFPARCIGCRGRGSWLCVSCQAKLTPLPAEHCKVCALPVQGVLSCSACWRDPPAFDSLTCGFLFEGIIRDAIHRLKYRGERHLATPIMQALLKRVEVKDDVDAIVPIPLHAQRLQQRGYNQSALLAQSLSAVLNVPVVEEYLSRVRDTTPQVSLPAARRRENVHNAFRVASRVEGSRILLVDDVATTGSTLRAAASALKRAGATRVDALIIARAPKA